MSDEFIETAGIKETDIVFDCPYCTKSLAIDYHGAGLYIGCPDCKNRVQVPIPDGMRISDLDSSDQDQAALVIRLRESLAYAQQRIGELEAEIADLRQRRVSLESQRTKAMDHSGEIAQQVEDAMRILGRISELTNLELDESES